MVGIVVVSHSRALGDAAVSLAREMVPDAAVRIEVAAGLDDGTFGTDAAAIAEAITAADDGAGVLVLMDLGSAILSAELALEFLDDELRDRVELSPAPLVEGLLAATVAVAGGGDLTEVSAEARSGLAGKSAQLGAPRDLAEPVPAGPEPADPRPAAIISRFVLTNRHGLHARPAARLARLVAGLDADVRIRNLTAGKDWVPARSLSRLTMLGALRGHELELSATGPDGQGAVDAVLALAQEGFGEPTDQLAALTSTQRSPVSSVSGAETDATPHQSDRTVLAGAPHNLRGRPAGPGIGIGPARIQAPGPVELPDRPVGSPTEEQHRLDRALAAATQELQLMLSGAANNLGAAESAIFEAHLALIDDPELLTTTAEAIANGRSAEAAWISATGSIAETIAQLDDEYLRARAADVREVQDHVLRALSTTVNLPAAATPGTDNQHPESADETTEPGVLIAADLTAAQAAQLDPATISAVVLAESSPASHAAILVRARGIPLVVAVGPRLLSITDGSEVVVDGTRGEVWIEPDAESRRSLLDRAQRQATERDRAMQSAKHPARTTDGLQILVGANLGSLADARAAADAGADLAGLVRTEFLFVDRETPPEVEEQVETYSALADAIGGRRLTLRTLDVGGDKPLPYAPVPASANPFLGVRGLRLSLTQPELFGDQLRAMVRVAHQTPVSVMFPMVTMLSELHAARRLLDEVIASEGHGTPAGLEVGIMVEVPAVALKAAEFATAVDFFSIGTNDLTQYALAAERGNPDVAAIGDPYDPGVLALIRATCRGAAGGPQVAVCGDLAGDPQAAALLVGLGVGTVSMAPPAIPPVKQAVRAVDSIRAADLATAALAMPGPAEVRTLFQPESAVLS
ncbi:MAG: phosphoenolpyruvate--protein phosphotransferase [Microlunatus sp.]